MMTNRDDDRDEEVSRPRSRTPGDSRSSFSRGMEALGDPAGGGLAFERTEPAAPSSSDGDEWYANLEAPQRPVTLGFSSPSSGAIPPPPPGSAPPSALPPRLPPPPLSSRESGGDRGPGGTLLSHTGTEQMPAMDALRPPKSPLPPPPEIPPSLVRYPTIVPPQKRRRWFKRAALVFLAILIAMVGVILLVKPDLDFLPLREQVGTSTTAVERYHAPAMSGGDWRWELLPKGAFIASPVVGGKLTDDWGECPDGDYGKAFDALPSAGVVTYILSRGCTRDIATSAMKTAPLAPEGWRWELLRDEDRVALPTSGKTTWEEESCTHGSASFDLVRAKTGVAVDILSAECLRPLPPLSWKDGDWWRQLFEDLRH